MRDELIERMKAVFGQDQRRIDHALAVLDLAEQIQRSEGGDLEIVQAAAVLHDIGIVQAERKYNSTAGVYQQIEGPPIARPILEALGWEKDRIEHVCKIIASHHTADLVDTVEFRCIWDADWIVNLQGDYAGLDPDTRQRMIQGVFKTPTGHRIAARVFGYRIGKG